MRRWIPSCLLVAALAAPLPTFAETDDPPDPEGPNLDECFDTLWRFVEQQPEPGPIPPLEECLFLLEDAIEQDPIPDPDPDFNELDRCAGDVGQDPVPYPEPDFNVPTFQEPDPLPDPGGD